MGGGKSRALCEDAFDEALLYPGLKVLICRQSHTSIVETTKKTMVDQVIPAALLSGCRKKESQGEDWLRLPNGSVFHFIGLDDPVRWFSSEVGKLVFDEAHEIEEDTVLKLRTRLRQRAPNGVVWPSEPLHRTTIAFNPATPGHWLRKWFIVDAEETDYGYRKQELWIEKADATLGTCEFFKALATDNTYLPAGYVEQQLAGLPSHLRRRFLEGIWEFITGTCYFDTEALTEYDSLVSKPWRVCQAAGHLSGVSKRDPVRMQAHSAGKWHIWKPPVKEKFNEETGRTTHAHRYVAAVDVSSGAAGRDYGAIQIVDVDDLEQVAEYRDHIDADLLAEEVLRAAAVYNGALIAPEITGGYGVTVVQELQRRLLPAFRNQKSKPQVLTQRRLDRISKRFTDVLGWDTTTKTRPLMLDTLERVIRERELKLNGKRTLEELAVFVRDEKGRPAAQPGEHDDLVISLAIAVFLAQQMPKQLRRRPKPAAREPAFASTGY